MKRICTLLFTIIAIGMTAAEPENLFPLPTLQKNRSLGDGAGLWHRTYVDASAVTAKLTVSNTSGNLDVLREGRAGCSSWRINLVNLAAGTYTLDTGVTCSAKSLIDVYAFDAAGKARLIYLHKVVNKVNLPIVATLEIPEGTTKVRFGFGVEDDGIASYKMPRLFAGQIAPEKLPPRSGESVNKGTAFNLLPQLDAFRQIPAKVHNEVVIDPYTGIKVELDGGTATQEGTARKSADGAWHFALKNRPVDVSAAAWSASFAKREIPAGSLFRMSYVAKGIAYTRVAHPVLSLNDVPLLYNSECYNDGLLHTVVGVIPQTVNADCVKLQLRTDAEVLDFVITDLQLFPDVEHLPLAELSGSVPSGVEILPLSGKVRQRQKAALKEALELRKKVYDYALVQGGNLVMDGLAFRVDNEWNVLYGKETSAPKDMGKMVGTVPLRGQGQAFDHVLTLTPTGKAKEIWLLLGSVMPAFSNNGATPVRPPQFAAHEVISAEIQYQDGTVDFAFPYSPADRGFAVQRFTGAYAVPLNPEKDLKKVILHSYFRPDQGEIFLMAATLNRTAQSCIPASVLNPAKAELAKRAEPAGKRALAVTETETGYTLENDWYKLDVALADGFRITGLAQKIAAEEALQISPESGLEIDWNGKVLTGRDFTVTKRTRLADGIALELAAKPQTGLTLAMKIQITGNGSGEFVFRSSMENTGKTRIAPRVRIPVLTDVKIGKNYADNWIYFPKYYTLCTNELTYAHCPGNERAYFVQFFDAYNPAAGYGLELLTHNLDSIVLDYGLFKAQGGLKYFIQYPAPWYMMNPGESKVLAETALNFHTGDWHTAFDHYKAWVKTWYKPVKKEKLEWWRHAQVARCEFFNKQYDWVLPIYLEQEDRFRLDELAGLAERRWGTVPEILHLWGWNCPPLYPGEGPRRGTPRANYPDGEFDPKNYFQGVDRLSALLAEQQKNGTHVSLYVIPSYLPKACPVAKARGKDVVRILGNGQPLIDDLCYFPCIGAWMDTFVAACARAYNALHFDALYVDISPFPRDYTCYSTQHGHGVPLNVNRASRMLFQKIRGILPEGVAFWHEDPAADVETQWSSGCMTYYHVTGSENRAPNYAETTNAPLLMAPRQCILRFAFPKYRMFAIPIGLTSSSMNMRYYHNPFFNGEGYSDSTVGVYNDRTMPVMRNAIVLQKRFAHLYESERIKPLVPTEAAGICANEFPSEDGKETLWTLYNARFQTYRGAVLKVPYQAGDVFEDVWNGKPLTPVVRDGEAVLELELHPQMVGAVRRIRK